MKMKSALFLTLALTACSSVHSAWQTRTDPFTTQQAAKIIDNTVVPEGSSTQGERIEQISAYFLGTPYQSDTLSGSATQPEVLVADFNGVDCFTLIDYVNALSHSQKPDDFLPQLIKTRYIDSKVDYLHRKHFFTDWFATMPRNATDVTTLISQDYVTVRKNLNRKSDGGEFISGLGTVSREINYIAGAHINQSVLDNLRTGDFIGVYSPIAGLDVSHVGIVIKKDGKVWFRNASSLDKNQKVVDSPLLDYMKSKPGIIVLRAL
ncbi:DUF1460 domain-containing protein [Erwinia mallotivora]|uniref:Membrane protein n=1 Tax=Erwinia mallotivora TaxID=69222 RepID=A0A014PYN3_9GAMM|nr:DUF1460 domain-containing protein [Erwinia mallotivora]EXU76097.1 membrane protein [Erwinia mallotivora]